jgi:hemoglobin
MRCFIPAVALGLLLMLAGCMSGSMNPENDSRSLYVRLGGEKGITAVTEDFLARLEKEPPLDLARSNSAHPWKPTPANRAILKVRAVALMSKVTGGPDYYEAVGGRDMKTAHKGMGISEAEWNMGVQRFKESLNACHVGQREQKELIDAVASLHDQIVEVK